MDFAEARRRYAESLAIARQHGNERLLAYALEGFAAVAAAEGSFERCLLLVGAAETLREKIAVPHQLNERPRWASRFDPARRALGELASTRLPQDGRTMTTSQAIAYALIAELAPGGETTCYVYDG